MIPMERMEELAARYVLGQCGPDEVAELEEALAASEAARTFFAEFCMDEVLLADALAPRPVGERTPRPNRHPRADRVRLLATAAALLLAFLGGWAAATVLGGEEALDERSARAPGRAGESTDPLLIYFPQAPSGLSATPAASTRLLSHPLDFDESGALSTNPYLKVVPMEVTEL